MPYQTLGTSSQLQIVVPTQGTTSWADTMKTSTFLKIAQHDHSGSGNGAQLGTGSIIADAITGAKVRLDNDEYLRARNNADSANLSLLKANTSDKIVFGTDIADINLTNNTYLTARNQADSADIDIVKVDEGDQLDFGTQVSVFNMKTNTYLTGRNLDNSGNINVFKIDAQDRVDFADGNLVLKGTATLTDNTSVAAAVPNFPTLSTDESAMLIYKIVRSTSVQFGTLWLDENGSLKAEECFGDDVGVTFTEDAGALDYVTTSTGNNATLTYTLIKL
jgi:hypothetical protein